jgi:hypothetical protein
MIAAERQTTSEPAPDAVACTVARAIDGVVPVSVGPRRMPPGAGVVWGRNVGRMATRCGNRVPPLSRSRGTHSFRA